MSPQTVRLLHTFVLTLGLTLLSYWIGGAVNLWSGSGWYYLSNGSVLTGDFYKHYAAGHFAAANDWEGLYSNGPFLEWERKNRRELAAEALAHSDHPAPPITIDNTPAFEDHFYVYPPLVASFASCLISFDYFLLPHVWLLLSIIFYVAAFFILGFTQPELKLFEIKRAIYYWAMPAFYFCIWMMQNSTLSLLLIVLAGFYLNRGKNLTAGIIVGGLFFKPQILLSLFIFMIMARRWRFITGLVAASLFWLLVGVLSCGLPAYIDWLSVLVQKWHLHRLENYYVGISWLSFYTYFHPATDTPQWLITFLTGVGLLIAAALGWFLRNAVTTQKWKPAFLLYLAVALWVVTSPAVFFYDWLLTLPWFYVVAANFRERLTPYLLLGSYVILSSCLHLSFSTLRFLPPPGSFLCAVWLAASLLYLLKPTSPVR